MNDYIDYKQTITHPDEEVYTDQYQKNYDWSDEYQGCLSYKQYIETWN